MHVNTGIWDKLTRVILVLILLACVMGVARWYLPVIQKNERMRKELRRLDQEIRKEEDIGRQLKSSIDALQHDPQTVERLAREKLGYAKPGETVIRFDETVLTTTNSITNSP
jgi:cell division protein FtsB